MIDVLVINGPNLNLLGKREPNIYGDDSLDSLNSHLVEKATQRDLSLEAWQSNAEHSIVEKIHAAKEQGVKFIIINAGAFTHTSIAIRDALLGVNIPFIETHLSNVFARESFRHNSYLADIALGVISGLGGLSYELAIEAAYHHLNTAE